MFLKIANTDYGIEYQPVFFYKLAPGESTKKIRRAKVGQLLPLRGEPVSGWVSNTLRRLVVRLKSSLFLVQVYGAAKKHF